MHKAVDEMARRETFRGYGPEQGYEFIRQAIAQNEFRDRGIDIADDEIFLSDGSKCDCGNILDILGHQNKIAIIDPVYPVYVDTNVMDGHTGPADEAGVYAGLVYLPCVAENGFVAEVPREKVDIIYLVLPEQSDRRGGHARAVDQMGRLRAGRQGDHPLRRGLRGVHHRAGHPAFDLRNPRRARLRDRVPQLLQARRVHRRALRVHGGAQIAQGARRPPARRTSLHPLWQRRWSTKFNGVSYPVQRAAEALYSPEGKAQVRALIEHYMGNAKVLRDGRAGRGAQGVWRRQRALHLGADAAGRQQLADVRPHSERGERGDHARQRLRRATAKATSASRAFNSRANAEEVARRLQALK